MSLIPLLEFIDKRLRAADLAGASVSGPTGALPVRFTYIPEDWDMEQRARANDILARAVEDFATEAAREAAIAQTRADAAAAGISVTYEPTGEQLQLWCRNETDFASYRNFSALLKDAIEFNLAPRAYRISTMQGGWDALVLPEGDNRVALRKMIAVYSDQAQQYYGQIR